MSSKLRFTLRSLTVPPTLPHKTRAEEIAEIPKYIEVAALIAPELVLMNMGEQEPGADRSDFPWIKLNSSGEPQGLFVNVGGTWEPAFSKLTIRSNLEDMVIESGSASIVLNVAANTVTPYASTFAFTKEFDEAPKMFLAITGGNILQTGSGDTHGAYTQIWAPTTEITTTEFRPYFISHQATNVASQTLEFTWIAIGKRSDT